MKLIYHPHPALEKQVQPFDFDKLDAKDIEKQMLDIMTSNHGVGLAANQVDLDAQIFVMEPKDLEGYEDGKPFAVINPKIEAVSEQRILGEEGCLSFPGLLLKVSRPTWIVGQWQNAKGETKEGKVDGYLAKCFQHEFDHLNGVCFVDRVSKLKLQLALKKLQKLRKKIRNDRT